MTEVSKTDCQYVAKRYLEAMREVGDAAIALIEAELERECYLEFGGWGGIDGDGRVELRFDLTRMLNPEAAEETPYRHMHKLIYQYVEDHFHQKGFGTYYTENLGLFYLTFGKITKELV
jgi:hypothetical protein